MRDLKRISVAAIICLVLLRVSIGWQFFYEGLWKFNTLHTAKPWSSEGYLKNAQGPLRDHFRALTEDPDDLKWLDYDAMAARWDNWRDRFTAHYGLSDDQQKRLARMLKGPDKIVVQVSAVPESAMPVLQSKPVSNVVTYDSVKGRLIVQGETPLQSDEAALLYASVPVVSLPDGYAKADEQGEAARSEDGAAIPPEPLDLEFYKAVERLEQDSTKLGFLQRLAANLKGNADRVGVFAAKDEDYRPEMAVGAVPDDPEWLKYGEIQVYKDLLDEYDTAQRRAAADFQHEQARMVWQKLQAKRAELVGPIRALDAELKRDAQDLLSPEQLALGAVPPERTKLWQADMATILGLLVLGTLLILGLGTRLAAIGGAVMLVMFYLPVPPWPGVYLPPEASGPEHSFIINKNLIEAFALLAIAALPSGTWFGLDGVIRFIFRRRR